jgi:hypothetical protein
MSEALLTLLKKPAQRRAAVVRVNRARKLAEAGRAVGAFEYGGQLLTLLLRFGLLTEGQADGNDRNALRRAVTLLLDAIVDGDVNALTTDAGNGVHDASHDSHTTTVEIRFRLRIPA